MCDPETETSMTLPNVLHGFALHLCYLRDKIISVTLDGHVVFFPKLPPFLPVRSSSVNTKVRVISSMGLFESKSSHTFVSHIPIVRCVRFSK